MNERIELFKMILERNTVVRAKWNAGSRYYYSFKVRHPLEKVQARLVDFIEKREVVTEFTKRTRKRRRQLMMSLRTYQHKNSDNYIHWIKLSGKLYTAEQMKNEVDNYEIDMILLGGNDE